MGRNSIEYRNSWRANVKDFLTLVFIGAAPAIGVGNVIEYVSTGEGLTLVDCVAFGVGGFASVWALRSYQGWGFIDRKTRITPRRDM